MAVQNLRTIMLKDKRQYIIDKVKAPLMKALIILARRYPQPTKENTSHPNTHALIDVFNKFFEMEGNADRIDLFMALGKVVVAEHEHDPFYRDRIYVLMELWLEQVLLGKWKPRSLDHPDSFWKSDPNMRGIGYEFMKDMYYYPDRRYKWLTQKLIHQCGI